MLIRRSRYQVSSARGGRSTGSCSLELLRLLPCPARRAPLPARGNGGARHAAKSPHARGGRPGEEGVMSRRVPTVSHRSSMDSSAMSALQSSAFT